MSKFKCLLLLIFLPLGTLCSQNQCEDLDSLIRELKNVKVDTQRVSLINGIAFCNIALNYKVAKDDVTIAYYEAKALNHETGTAASLLVMGAIHWTLGDYEKSLSHYLEALKIYEKLGNIDGRSSCLNNIGEVYKKLGEYDNALKYLMSALELKEKDGTAEKEPLIYSNLGELYFVMDEPEKAQEYYFLAIKLAKKEGVKKVLAYSANGLGELYLSKAQYDQSILHFRKAADYNEKLGDNRGLAYSLTNLGSAYFAQNKYDSAKFYYNQSFQTAEYAGARDIKLNLYKSLAYLDTALNNYEQGFINIQNYTELKDSIFSETKSAQIARMQAEYENELLTKDNETKSEAVKQRNTLIIGVIMLLILTLALTYTFNNQRKYQKKANEILHTKNETIASQNLEIQSQAVSLKSLNDNLANLNENLEDKIRFRTKLLEVKNQELADYAFIHAHELRAPLSNILGLVQLLKHSNLAEKDKEMIEHLYLSTAQLDQVIQKIASKESEEDFKTKS